MRFTAHSNLFLFNVKRKSILLSMLSWVCMPACFWQVPLLACSLAASFLEIFVSPFASLETHLPVGEWVYEGSTPIVLALESSTFPIGERASEMTCISTSAYLVGVGCDQHHSVVPIGWLQ